VVDDDEIGAGAAVAAFIRGNPGARESQSVEAGLILDTVGQGRDGDGSATIGSADVGRIGGRDLRDATYGDRGAAEMTGRPRGDGVIMEGLIEPVEQAVQRAVG